jgi:hypothetical protein
MQRREFLRRSALTGAGLAMAPLLKLSEASADPLIRRLIAPGPPRAATSHCQWGAFAMPQGSQTNIEALLALEAMVGRKMAIHRNYQGMDTDLLSKEAVWLSQRGTTPYRSFHAWTGSQRNAIKWADIAAGNHDSWLRVQAKALGDWGRKMYICFHHEPEDDTTGNPQSQTYQHRGCGSAADYRAAYNHVRQIFSGVSNLTWVVTLLSPTYMGSHGGPAAWYPKSYDLVGVDGYNRWPCSGSDNKTFAEKFSSARDFAVSKGKRMVIPEWGTIEQTACGHSSGDSNGKAKWFVAAGNALKSWPEVKWVSYSHVIAGSYNFRCDSSGTARAAFTTLGIDPYFS